MKKYALNVQDKHDVDGKQTTSPVKMCMMLKSSSLTSPVKMCMTLKGSRLLSPILSAIWAVSWAQDLKSWLSCNLCK